MQTTQPTNKNSVLIEHAAAQTLNLFVRIRLCAFFLLLFFLVLFCVLWAL